MAYIYLVVKRGDAVVFRRATGFGGNLMDTSFDCLNSAMLEYTVSGIRTH